MAHFLVQKTRRNCQIFFVKLFEVLSEKLPGGPGGSGGPGGLRGTKDPQIREHMSSPDLHVLTLGLRTIKYFQNKFRLVFCPKKH